MIDAEDVPDESIRQRGNNLLDEIKTQDPVEKGWVSTAEWWHEAWQVAGCSTRLRLLLEAATVLGP